MRLHDLVAELDEYLAVRDYDDRSNNGLQVEGRTEVNRIGLAVDACQEAFDKAVAAKVDLILVHHGLFWGDPLMVTGAHRRRLSTLLKADISLYGAHLPLDGHPEVGNNAVMARLLGLKVEGGFGFSNGRPIGLTARAPEGTSLEDIRLRLGQSLGIEAHSWPFRERVSRVGLVMGKATSLVSQAIDMGIDALVCGELEHMVYHTLREAGLGAVLGGHYHTETVGVAALGQRLASRHGLETVWIEAPTGL